MKDSKTYINLIRANGENLTEVMLRDHKNEFLLLTLIAMRARRSLEPHPTTGLKQFQCMIGDHDSCGLSLQNYRTAKKNLEKWKLLTCTPTNNGTIATLCNGIVYDINPEQPNKQTNVQLTNNQQTTNNQLTTNKNVKNVKKEKTEKDKFKSDPESGLGCVEFGFDSVEAKTTGKPEACPPKKPPRKKSAAKNDADGVLPADPSTCMGTASKTTSASSSSALTFDYGKYLDAWKAVTGGTPSGKYNMHLAKTLKKLEAEHGTDFLFGCFKAYLKKTDKQYLSLKVFLEKPLVCAPEKKTELPITRTIRTFS